MAVLFMGTVANSLAARAANLRVLRTLWRGAVKLPPPDDCVPCRGFIPFYLGFWAGQRWVATVLALLSCTAISLLVPAWAVRRHARHADALSAEETQSFLGYLPTEEL